MTKIYVVVENAGYERECTVFQSPKFTKACEWMERHYDFDELDKDGPNSLHVEIAVEIDGVRSYEF
jgi:hypothetical protein